MNKPQLGAIQWLVGNDLQIYRVDVNKACQINPQGLTEDGIGQ